MFGTTQFDIEQQLLAGLHIVGIMEETELDSEFYTPIKKKEELTTNQPTILFEDSLYDYPDWN